VEGASLIPEEPPELLTRDRNLIALLHEAGIGPGSSAGLCWRLREVDGLDAAEISRQTGLKEATVQAYCDRVDRRIFRHLHPTEPLPPALLRTADLSPEEQAECPEETTLHEAAVTLLRCVANSQPGEGGCGFAAPCDPVVSVEDAYRIICGEVVEFLPVIPSRGWGRRWREYLR
jgi:hypothetical protein